MDFRPIVAPSIRELFIQQLEGAILSGQLKPGDRLPTERELADTMQMCGAHSIEEITADMVRV